MFNCGNILVTSPLFYMQLNNESTFSKKLKKCIVPGSVVVLETGLGLKTGRQTFTIT